MCVRQTVVLRLIAVSRKPGSVMLKGFLVPLLYLKSQLEGEISNRIFPGGKRNKKKTKTKKKYVYNYKFVCSDRRYAPAAV